MSELDPTTLEAARPRATWRDYVAVARPDHWIKHIFIVPGVVVAELLHPKPFGELLVPLLLGFASAAAVASANYVLNEWLDARSDAHHPVKSERPGVRKRLSGLVVALEYLALAAVGLALAIRISALFAATAALFLILGWIYNVRPVRTKDRAYLDVLTESLNNPVRLALGWAIVDGARLPPSSLLLAYWMGGAFLMAVKRLAEYRSVVVARDKHTLVLYRRAFQSYTESSLLLSSFSYAQLAAFFLAVFLVKYRIEYVLSLPLFAALFAVYLWLGLRPGSTAQTPEKLFREPVLVAVVVLLVGAMLVLTWVDLPFLEHLSDPHYILLPSAGD